MEERIDCKMPSRYQIMNFYVYTFAPQASIITMINGQC